MQQKQEVMFLFAEEEMGHVTEGKWRDVSLCVDSFAPVQLAHFVAGCVDVFPRN